MATVKQYLYSYISDGIEHSLKIWASCETEAEEKLRALPWEPGNGPVTFQQDKARHETTPDASLLVLLILAVGLSMMFHYAEADMRRTASAGDLKHLSHLLRPHKPYHRA
ncbi:hypothetical protein [Manganibacter manganicus]|uniref:Uncharacterized protein n=1 Tax=Manganibacter manganicus TaxID=1873176 RepID=A0A1V8RU08_9HYPH|nr:hypothetical protein [Pseudaminobacter manganicus]OQM76672.1 hypothetical protein BFN67_13680 [Pseudaminobacter manganicus]